MTRHPTGTPCERASCRAALAPDGELSVLEQRLLDAHLARCSGCRRFAGQVATVAAELRALALQPLPRPVSIPTWRRRSVAARVRAIGSAAAVAVMALGVASRAPLSSGEERSFPLPAVADLPAGDRSEGQALRDLRRETIVAEMEARNRAARHFGNLPA